MVLKTRLIPSVLFMNGITVKSKKFSEYRPVGSYINIVRVYNAREVDELIFLDISATKEKRSIPHYVVSEIAKECNMPLSIGGGINNLEIATKMFLSSADKISINSACSDKEFVSSLIEKFGSANIIASVDVKKIGDKYNVFKNNGKENTNVDAIKWAQNLEELGVGEIFLTSIDNDGMMNGYNIELIKQITDNTKIPIIASGGAGKPMDFVNVILDGGANAVSAASIFHFTQYTPKDIKIIMEKEGISVRL